MTSIPVDTTYLIPGQSIDASDVVIPLIDLEHGIEGMLDGVYDFLKTVQATATALTIASDAITVTQTYHALNLQGGVSDELRTITRSGQVDMVVLWKNTADPQTLKVRHNIGNILLDSARDVTIDNRSTALVLIWNAGTSKWNGNLVHFGDLWFAGNVPFVQIFSDAINPPSTNKFGVYAESGLTDNLATINHGAVTSAMDIIFVFSVNTYTITLKHNTGNIFFPSGRDVILDSTSDWAMLVWNDVTSKWYGQSSTELRNQSFQTPLGSIPPQSILTVPLDTILKGSAAGVSGVDGVLPTPVQFLARKRPVMANEIYDFAIGATTFASFGGTFTTTGTPTDGANAESQWVTLTSGAVAGNKAQRIGPACVQLRWNPWFEASFKDYGASSGDNTVNYGGLIGLFSASPTVGASGITVWTGIYGVGFSYGWLNGNLTPKLIQVDNGVVTDLFGPTLISPGQGQSRPVFTSAGICFLYVDFPNSRLYYYMSLLNTNYGNVAMTISGGFSTALLSPLVMDATKAAVAESFDYRHMLVNWKGV